MASINLKERRIDCKIVYYGPGRCGKTTNLQHIHDTFKKQVAGEMISIETKGDRTLFFDFLPIGLGKIRGCSVNVQLYTVPGQVKYRSTREMVLRGVDGVVFVADSLAVRREKNMLSLRDLHENLKKMNLRIDRIPLVLQFNKRDLVDEGFPVMPVEQMEKELNRQLKVPAFIASAISGKGVKETVTACMQITLRDLHRKFKWAQD